LHAVIVVLIYGEIILLESVELLYLTTEGTEVCTEVTETYLGSAEKANIPI